MANEVVRFQEPRLPYHPVVEERFGITKTAWKALTEAVYPAAKTADAVVMALAYCKARNLDPFKRPVHIVPVWDSNAGKMVETVWPGISELRTTAMRTKQFAGNDEVEFGPDITKHYEWTDKKNAKHVADVTFPEWARMTVYRLLHGARVQIVGPKAYWEETYASQGKSDAPNDMWRKRPRGQIEKCAEAGALRRAFPEELGDEPSAEEMEGRTVEHAPPPVAGLTDGFGDEKPTRSPRKPKDGEPSNPAAEPGDDVHAPQEAAGDAEFEEAEFEDAGRPTSAAGDTATDGAPAAETEPDMSGYVAPASEATPSAAAAPSPSGPGGAHPADVIAEGYPNENEVYMLNGDEWAWDEKRGDDRRDTYKNGEPFSDAGRDKGHKIYEDHAPQGGGATEDEDEPKTTAAPGEVYLLAGDAFNAEGKRATYKDGVRFGAVSEKAAGKLTIHDFHAPIIEEVADDEFPGDRQDAPGADDPFPAAIAAIKAAAHYPAARGIRDALVKTDAYGEAAQEAKNGVLLALWARYVELCEAKTENGEVWTDFALMRMFLMYGATSPAQIDELWAKFWRNDAYKKATEANQRAATDLMLRRKEEMKAKADG